MKNNGMIIYVHLWSCSYIIVFLSSKSLKVVQTKINDQGRILMLDIKICDREFLLVTLYNENNEKKEFACLNLLSEMLNNIPYIVKSIILGGNFNLFFVTSF